MDDLFREYSLYGSLQDAGTPGPRNAGFVKGVRDQCALLGFSLAADQPRLLPVCLETVMGISRLQLQSEAVNVDVYPRTCPTEGAACCKHTRWLRRTLLDTVYAPVHELPASPRKVLQLLRFRLGCHTLPSATGQRKNPCVPRDQRICTRCQHGLGDERRLVFA